MLPYEVVFPKKRKKFSKMSSCDFRLPKFRNDYRSPQVHYQNNPLRDF